MAVEYILKNSLLRRTLDNVTVVMISFKNFKNSCFGEDKPDATIDHTVNLTMDESKVAIQEGSSSVSLALKPKENIPPSSISDENSSTAFNKARLSLANSKQGASSTLSNLHIFTEHPALSKPIKSTTNALG